MVKKFLIALLMLALYIPAAALADLQVIDEAGVVDAEMEQLITQVIDDVEKKHQVDLVVLVTYDVPDDYSDSLWRVEAFADDFYDNGGYGLGDDYSGLLYLIDLNNRVQYISCGGVMMDYINDYREEKLLDAGGMFLSSSYGKAALAVMQKVQQFMDEGRMKGSFRYDEETGKRLTGLYNPLEGFEILLAGGGGIAAALILMGSVKGSYSLKGSTYSYALNQNSSCVITHEDEQYLRQTVTRMARSTGSHGGSGGGGSRSGGRGTGVHRSSSGRSHSGGGRRF